MRKLLPSIIVITLALCALSGNSVFCEDRAAENKETAAISKDAAELGLWCFEKGFADKAKELLGIAQEAANEGEAVAKLVEALNGDVTATPGDAEKTELETREKAFRKKSAESYIKLYSRKGKSTDGRFRAFLERAIRLVPTEKGPWRAAGTEVDALLATKATDELARFVPRILALKDAPPTAKADIIKKEMSALVNGGVLRKATKHEMLYYVALPRKWSPDLKWPVLVTVEGAGCGFSGNHSGFVGGRSDQPLIVITMHTLSNTNALEPGKYKYPEELLKTNNASDDRIAFDSAGLAAVLSDIGLMYNAMDRVCITGFSGGGYLTYFTTFQHPELVTAAFPCCANFAPQFARGAATPTEEQKKLAIYIFTGADDPHKNDVFGQKPGIEGQNDWAVDALKQLGYSNITRSMLPGVGHSACVNEVWGAIGKLGIKSTK
ncbi:MAG: hypothetical protein WC712_03915 [Candidatus Brocadiia bacterium]